MQLLWRLSPWLCCHTLSERPQSSALVLTLPRQGEKDLVESHLTSEPPLETAMKV